MALNLPTADGGHRVPIVKYDSRAGRIRRVDRVEGANGWEGRETEITDGFQAAIDLENIEVGWLHFPTGGAPNIVTVKYDKPLPDRPSEKHRAGYRVMLKLGKSVGGDVREMAANAAVAIKAMDILHDQYLAERTQHPGQLPVIKLAGTLPITTQGQANGQKVSSTNYQPQWAIAAWVDRPAELQPDYKPPETQQQAAAPQPPPPPPPAPPPPPPPAPPPPPPPAASASVQDDF